MLVAYGLLIWWFCILPNSAQLEAELAFILFPPIHPPTTTHWTSKEIPGNEQNLLSNIGRSTLIESKLVEDDISGRQPQWKTISVEDNLSGRQPQWKTTSVEDDLSRK